ncbi:hypothetical protein [Mycolicibacterium brumae]|uniref:Cyclodehydratase n=1 Tax=Mycolicibacterium brumae TaxID=85968 RepID=A0A2G5PDE0_9MYCO|nr:hypothetical protein [Mycolicibacterium brumae]MCV7193163.1 cyclodehydratase [Mycolicibacterium brumae]PIB75924.1 cyclodehydratase [Mycolicibacterium brumae]RWA16602.1 hypothetical protein MBRU_07715 [Mycolicibacterium brumae DSM 44177]UWW09818.1 cyclodehydratase [Mycolicibacterium brumae]
MVTQATRYRLDPALAVLCRPDGAAQIGWDPRRAVLVRTETQLRSAALVSVLRHLQGGASVADLRNHLRNHVQSTVDDGLDSTIDDLVGELVAAGIVTPEPTPTPSAQRKTRSAGIRIHGPGPLAQLLRDGLSHSGARVTCTSSAGIVVDRTQTDLVVLTDHQVVDPRLARELTRDRIAHLPVRVRDGRGLVGPLVIPGMTSCLNCADLHRADRDPAWPALAAQLRDRIGLADRSTLLATSALALRQVDAVIEAVAGGPRPPKPAALATTLEVDVAAGSILSRRWRRHPACSC